MFSILKDMTDVSISPNVKDRLYRKDTEHLYHAFVYSLIMNNNPFIRDFVTLNKAVINYLPRCSYHLLYKPVNTFEMDLMGNEQL